MISPTIDRVVLPVIEHPSAFRMFCNETWYEHKDEILVWTGKQVDYDATYYFRKHRWLLKKMFKESAKKG
jgi:hypothetical protein